MELRETPASRISASSQFSQPTPSSCAIVNWIDALEIGLVHHVLAAGAAPRFLAQLLFQRIGHGIERGHAGQAERGAALFQPIARFGVDQRKQHQAGVSGNFTQDAVKMLLRTDHRPEMPHDIGILELGKGRFGNHFKGFTC